MNDEVQSSLLLRVYKHFTLKNSMIFRRISKKWNKSFWENIADLEENFNITEEDHWRVIKLVKVASYIQELELYQSQIRNTFELSRSVRSDERDLRMTRGFGLFQVCSCDKCLGLEDDCFSEECSAWRFEKYAQSRKNVLVDGQIPTNYMDFPVAPWAAQT